MSSGGQVPEPASGTVPVCPRHPDRESYVRCQRCERPVCPACQRPAAVGVQCVDCVRRQSKGVRVARTAFGARTTDSWPWVTYGIIAACGLVYFLQALPGSTVTREFLYAPVATLADPYRLVTSAFLHSPTLVLHILFNMYALWLLGPYLENLLGHVRFALLYLLSAFGGSVFFLLLVSPDSRLWFAGAVGASGAVFGLFGALLVVQRRLNLEWRSVIALIAINAAFSFLPNVAWQVHLGGLITGLAVTLALAYAPQRNRNLVQGAGMAVVLVLLVAVALLKLSTVPPDRLICGPVTGAVVEQAAQECIPAS